MPFLKTPLSASYVQGYNRFAKADSRWAASVDDGNGDDISQYDNDVAGSGTDPEYWTESNHSSIAVSCPRSLDASFYTSASADAYSLWYGSTVGQPAYAMLAEGSTSRFLFMTSSGNVAAFTNFVAPASATLYTAAWSTEIHRTSGSNDTARHEFYLIRDGAGIVSSSFVNEPLADISTQTNLRFAVGADHAGNNRSGNVVATRVGDNYRTIEEIAYDHNWITASCQGEGIPGIDPPVFDVDSGAGDAGAYFGPVAAQALNHARAAKRKNVSPINRIYRSPPRHTWANIQSDKLLSPVFDGASHYTHMGWLANLKLGEGVNVNRLYIETDFVCTAGSMNVWIGCRQGWPRSGHQDEYYYIASGTFSGSGSVTGSVPIARVNSDEGFWDDTTTVFVAVSGSTAASSIEVRSLKAFPYFLTGSGFGFSG